MDDLIDAVAQALEPYVLQYELGGLDIDPKQAAVDAIAAILRIHGSKPDPIEEAYRAGWFGSQSWHRGARPDEAYARWRENLALTAGQAHGNVEP